MANLIVSYEQKFKAYPEDKLGDALFCIPNIEQYSNEEKRELFDTVYDCIDAITGRMFEFAGVTFNYEKSINLLNNTKGPKNPYLPQISYDKISDAELVKQNMLRKKQGKNPILTLYDLDLDVYHWKHGMTVISDIFEKTIAKNFKDYVQKNFASSDIDYPIFELKKYNLGYADFKKGVLKI